ncbi:MAG: helix-turn-helix domain-containing protein, partial [Spirochaetota bacterium]
VRILAATNIDLRAKVRANAFRRDLYYRLSVFPLMLPPLRKRRGDIPVLAEFFREQYTAQFDRPVRGFEPKAMKQLRSYGWPGNVRELSNMVIRLVVGATSELIREADVVEALYQTAMQLPEDAPEGEGDPLALVTAGDPAPQNAPSGVATASAETPPEPEPVSHREPPEAELEDEPAIQAGRTIEDVERQLIEATLREARGNRTKAAKLLGISRKSLYNKIKSYGIEL